jgi:hypothetical protein
VFNGKIRVSVGRDGRTATTTTHKGKGVVMVVQTKDQKTFLDREGITRDERVMVKRG